MKSFVVSYKGRGKGFESAEKIVQAGSKKEAKDKVYEEVNIPIVIKSVEPLLRSC